MYKKYPPQGNILASVFRCIGFALKNRWRHRSKQYPKREHWLDWAEEKFQKRLITEVKMVTKVLFLYIPLPMFWALFDQQGSRWTLQATRMNSDFGGFVLQPDQIQILNPLLILILIPIFDLCIYPLVRCCKIDFKAIPKMAIGMILAALAFAVATVVEIKINETLPPVPKAQVSYLQVLNLAGGDVDVDIPGFEIIKQPSLYGANALDPDYVKLELTTAHNNFDAKLTVGAVTADCPIHIQEKSSYSLLVYGDNLNCDLIEESQTKPANGLAAVRFINMLNRDINVTIGESTVSAKGNNGVSPYITVKRGKITATYPAGAEQQELDLGLLNFGAAYSVILVRDLGDTIEFKKTEDVSANSFHVAWQVPQYVLLSAGEVMFSVTGLEFSYSQAPISMKSVLQAGWLFTIAIGNVIVLIVAQAGSLAQWAEFILFAALLVAVCIIFSIMGYFYVPANPDDLKEEEELEKKQLPEGEPSAIPMEERKTKM
ncbi:hypothetical protein XENTR_v10024882 [Xenopus tropicalis]|nr:hypothetical protein XENTR_v10024882 [Xenopus tropicalis]